MPGEQSIAPQEQPLIDIVYILLSNDNENADERIELTADEVNKNLLPMSQLKCHGKSKIQNFVRGLNQ